MIGGFQDIPRFGRGVSTFVHPLGLAPKSVPWGDLPKWRSTADLSRAKVNDLIRDETARVLYPSIPGIARRWASKQGWWAVVFDVEAAFRNLPIHPSQYRFATFYWDGTYYVDTRLNSESAGAWPGALRPVRRDAPLDFVARVDCKGAGACSRKASRR